MSFGRYEMKSIKAHVPAIFLALLLHFMNPHAIAGGGGIGLGQTKPEVIAALDSTIPNLMAKARIPGLSVALIWDGEVAWEKGYGTKNKKTGEPVDSRTIFEAASLTKPFFASVALSLVDSGVIDLDRPLVEYIPQDSIESGMGHPFDYPGFRADWLKRITARMVLSHSSGLPHGQGGKPYPILFEPGSKFSYSADGYYFLQKAIEHLLREPLQETMRKRIIEPLHMDRSSMVWDDRFSTNVAVGHSLLGITSGSPRKRTEAHAAASLYTTAGDYAKFVAALMRGSFLGPRSVDQMLTPQINVSDSVSWSLGFGIEKTSSGAAFFQWGDYGIFRNYVVALRSRGRALVYLTNSFFGLAIGKTLVPVATGIEEDFGLRWLAYEPYDSETSAFFYAIAERSAEESVRLYHDLRSKDSPATGEDVVNGIAYELLRSGAHDKALVFFELNIQAYPKSANPYDSMGEACETVGDLDRAAINYQKALDALPNDTTRSEASKARLREIFQKNLTRVTGDKNPSPRP
jgi:CubicO group peptidase (beta-lactamase class C family)